jgi:hypothetical protein
MIHFERDTKNFEAIEAQLSIANKFGRLKRFAHTFVGAAIKDSVFMNNLSDDDRKVVNLLSVVSTSTISSLEVIRKSGLTTRDLQNIHGLADIAADVAEMTNRYDDLPIGYGESDLDDLDDAQFALRDAVREFENPSTPVDNLMRV